MCSAANFAYRLEHAAPFFKAVVSPPSDSSSVRILGFVVGTLSVASELHHQSMFEHAPEGRYLCIHSVVVAAEWRRRGLASAMLREYLRQVRAEQGSSLDAVVLICKRHLIPLYEGCGFKLVGPSAVVHGVEQWFECRMPLAEAK